jgi:hypothetical protein
LGGALEEDLIDVRRRRKCGKQRFTVQTQKSGGVEFPLYLNYKLMDLPNDFAVKAVLLNKTCEVGRQFCEKHHMILTSDSGSI